MTNEIGNLQSLVGMKLEDAQDILREAGIPSRVRSKAGQPMVLTCDYKPARINFEVDDNGMVSGFTFG